MTAVAVPESLAERLMKADRATRRRALARLTPEQRLTIAQRQTPWWLVGRTDQLEPGGDWRWWLILAGRGWGKTRTGGETVSDWARCHPGCRLALVAPTFGDGRDTMVEGVSGLLSHTDFTQLRDGSVERAWNRSHGELYYSNGSHAKVFSSENAWRLRGTAHHFIWGDEPSYWRDVARGTANDSTFAQANITLREKPRPGWPAFRPRGVLTGTPRLVPLLKVPDTVLTVHPEQAGLLQRPDVHLTTGATVANLRNLDPAYYEAVVRPLLGTQLGIQELGGVLLEQVEGALFRGPQIGRDRAQAPDLARVVVSFDPAGGEGPYRDEHGIIVAGSAGPRSSLHAYLLDDRSGSFTVERAAVEVILAAAEYRADEIVFEKNQGQDWIPATIRATFDAIVRATEPASVDELADDLHRALWAAHEALPPGWALPPVVAVTAIRDKARRAVPVQTLSEQHRIHFTRPFPVLENQMTTWVPGEGLDSPDRLDAFVWAVLHLYGIAGGETSVASPAARERGGRRPQQPAAVLPATAAAVYGRRRR